MNRNCVVILAALWALAPLAQVAAQPNALEERKQDAVRCALESQERQVEDKVLIAAASRASALVDVQFPETSASRATLSLRTESQTPFRIERSANGLILEVDLLDTIPFVEGRKFLPENRSLIKQAKVRFYSLEPQFASRLTIELTKPCVVKTRRSGGCVELTLESLPDALSLPRIVCAAIDERENKALAEQSLLVEYAQRELDAYRLGAGAKSASASLAKSQARQTELMANVARYVDEVKATTKTMREKADALSETDAKTLQKQLDAACLDDEKIFDAFAQEYSDLSSLLAKSIGGLSNPEGFAPSASPGLAVKQVPAFEAVDIARVNMALAAPQSLAATSGDTGDTDVSITLNPDGSRSVTRKPAEEPTPSQPEAEAPTIEAPAPEAEAPTAEAPAPMPREGEAETAPRSAGFQIIAPEAKDIGIGTKVVADSDNPLNQRVTLNYRNIMLTDLLGSLAEMADISVITDPDVPLDRTISVYLQDVPLLSAIETVLRMSNLGIVEEEGIYRVVPYADAIAAKRTTRMIYLQSARAADVEKTLMAVASSFTKDEQVNVASSDTTNVIVLSGLAKNVDALEQLTYELDVAEPKLPMETAAISLNYAEPEKLMPVVESMLTQKDDKNGQSPGKIQADVRSRQLIVTDSPGVIKQVKEMVKSLDTPVKQVTIEAMIVDAVLSDGSQTGVTWLLDLVNKRSRTTPSAPAGVLNGRTNQRGEAVGSLNEFTSAANMATDGNAGTLAFGILASSFDLRGAINAEVSNKNAEILANPMITTMENQEATIGITQEYPYRQLTQSTDNPGDGAVSTSFKETGINLTVTPRVTNNSDVLCDVKAEHSYISGFASDGTPITDARTTQTNLRAGNHRTIYVGGLRNISDTTDHRKIPILGDIPVVNFLFRNNIMNKKNTELLLFLTCHVQDDDQDLTPEQQVKFDKIADEPETPNSQRDMFHSIGHPSEERDPAWKWRRSP